MTLKKYTFELKHDGGNINLSTVASSEWAARTIICKAELCPNSTPKLIGWKLIAEL